MIFSAALKKEKPLCPNTGVSLPNRDFHISA